MAGRPSFVIAPLLACSGAAVIAALRVSHHPAGPFAASLVEGVLPLGTAVAVARLLGTDPALEDGYLALIRRHARASARALPD
jgi:hypothetical protein